MLWEQGVEGSNPFAPTLKIKELQRCNSFFHGKMMIFTKTFTPN